MAAPFNSPNFGIPIFRPVSQSRSPGIKGSGKKMDAKLLMMLDRIRDIVGEPLIITSGYRSESWNAKVGGVEGSSHTKGLAVDISIRNSRMRFKLINALVEVGINRIGIADNFIHIDIDPDKHKNKPGS